MISRALVICQGPSVSLPGVSLAQASIRVSAWGSTHFPSMQRRHGRASSLPIELPPIVPTAVATAAHQGNDVSHLRGAGPVTSTFQTQHVRQRALTAT